MSAGTLCKVLTVIEGRRFRVVCDDAQGLGTIGHILRDLRPDAEAFEPFYQPSAWKTPVRLDLEPSVEAAALAIARCHYRPGDAADHVGEAVLASGRVGG